MFDRFIEWIRSLLYTTPVLAADEGKVLTRRVLNVSMFVGARNIPLIVKDRSRSLDAALGTRVDGGECAPGVSFQNPAFCDTEIVTTKIFGRNGDISIEDEHDPAFANIPRHIAKVVRSDSGMVTLQPAFVKSGYALKVHRGNGECHTLANDEFMRLDHGVVYKLHVIDPRGVELPCTFWVFISTP